MSERLLVRIQGVPAGELVDHGPTTSFRLLEPYLLTPERPVLGQAFEDDPTRRWSFRTRVHPWFANLLPEGELRRWLADRMGVAPVDDAAFLAAAGADLPGAVTIEALAEDAKADEIIETAVPVPHDAEGSGGDDAGVRMSVAGFQLKLSMLFEANGKGLTLPGRGRLGGHLVKLPARGYDAVPENEFATMRWATSSGLDVPDVSLVAIRELDLPEGIPLPSGEYAFVIRRFDRDDAGGRVHIEDLNQVLGSWPQDKYEGVSYESLGQVIVRSTGSDDDLWEYVRRLVFLAAAGNEDAHKKNWSLRYLDGRSARLSPAYDLVSTVQYEELSRSMALSLGRSKVFDDIDERSFDRLARRVESDETTMRKFVREAADRTVSALADHLGDMPDPARLEAHIGSVPLFAAGASS